MGNARSGRRPSLERILRDAGMDARLVQEATAAAAAEHRDLGRRLVVIHQAAVQAQRTADDALAELRRSRLHAVSAPAAVLPEAA